MKKFLFFLVFAIYSTTGMAIAATQDQSPDSTPPLVNFQLPPGLDANDDGVVTRIEHQAFFARKFNNMDTDHNGKITKKEFIAGIEREFKRVSQATDNISR